MQSVYFLAKGATKQLRLVQIPTIGCYEVDIFLGNTKRGPVKKGHRNYVRVGRRKVHGHVFQSLHRRLGVQIPLCSSSWTSAISSLSQSNQCDPLAAGQTELLSHECSQLCGLGVSVMVGYVGWRWESVPFLHLVIFKMIWARLYQSLNTRLVFCLNSH